MTSDQPPPPPPGGGGPAYGAGPQPGAGRPGWGQQPPPPGWGQPPAPGWGQPPPAPGQHGQQPYVQQPAHVQQPGDHAGAPGPGFEVDLKRLRMADYVVAGGAVAYLILALLPWVDFGDYFDVDIPGDSISGFSFSGLVSFSFILFLLAAAWAVLPAFADVKLGFPHSWGTVGLAGLGLLLTLVAWIQTLQYGFEICPLLALLVAAAITVFAFLRLLPELRSRSALPGGLAGATQWANQPAPGAPGTGHPGDVPAQPHSGPATAGQPYVQPYVQPQASPYGTPGGPSMTGAATPPTAPMTAPIPGVTPGAATPPPPPPVGGASTGSTEAGTDPSDIRGEPPRPGA